MQNQSMLRPRSSAASRPSIEPLEPRIAPAAITINPALKSATWTDFDGDLITMKWTGTSAPTFDTIDNGLGLLVNKITFTKAEHQGIGFSLAVKASATGDGRLEVGRINATGVDLGVIAAPKVGVLEFDAGSNSDLVSAVKSLTLGGIGNVSGFFTGGGNNVSTIFGSVGAFTVLGDLGSGSVQIGDSSAKIGPVKIGGSLRGDFAGGLSGQLIITGSSVGKVTIGGDVIGGYVADSGKLSINGAAPSLVIKGSIVGGIAASTGEVNADQLNAFALGGSLIGGSGYDSGTVSVGPVKAVTIGGSVLGGSGNDSACFFINGGGTSKMLIKGSIVGGQLINGTEGYTGLVQTTGSFSSFVLKGDLIAGRTITGTTSYFNGAILSFGPINVMKIGGSVIGNDQTHAVITATQALVKPVSGLETVIGSLKIGRNVAFADMLAGYTTSTTPSYATAVANGDAGIGSITVGGNWFHSTAMAGVKDIGENGPTTDDVRAVNSSALLTARIGSVVIKGALQDSTMTSNFSGFQAEQIGKIVAAGRVLYQTGGGTRSLDLSSNAFAREI